MAKKPAKRGLGRGLSALMNDAGMLDADAASGDAALEEAAAGIARDNAEFHNVSFRSKPTWYHR